MFDIGADLQRAYSDGYKCGRLEALAELKRYISEMADYNDKADRKTENNSEKTNNCDTCRHYKLACELFSEICKYEPKDEPQTCDTCRFELYCPEMCEGCCEWDSHYEPKDEPTISKMEQVEDKPTEITYQNCSDALLKIWMDNVLTDAEYNRIMDKLNKAQRKDEPQYDTDKGTIKCDNCSENGSYKCSKCDGEMYFKRLAVKDKPQTCDTCKYGEDKHKYAHICNECGVGINNYEPKDGRE